MSHARPGDCKHPTISDEQLDERELEIAQTWGDAEPLKCPGCDEWLYPCVAHEIVCAGEPHHAGDDPAGRPSASTHPEYWTE